MTGNPGALRERCDVVVVGAGHAGCEAALAAARRGLTVVVVTPNLDRVAWMSCNPSIGGVGKGHLVREIDALGGEMGRAADRATIHARTLNSSKGPAVRATRVQADMVRYALGLAGVLDRTAGVVVRQGLVEQLLVEQGRVVGVTTALGEELRARAVVLTTGTFLRAVMHVGDVSTEGGRAGEPAAPGLSAWLAAQGFPLGRLKTGTCPRLDGRSIDYTQLEQQPPEDDTPPFSVDSEAHTGAGLPCHITYTSEQTHALIHAALDRSPLFTGKIDGRGPRYCPSIEDKVVRFAHKERHQIFLEPEGTETCEVYPSGLSTSLPADVQLAVVRSLPGLARARVRRWGYAVEYDFVPPTELWPSLETKRLPGLYLAGQINGTSGYEEAAAQGLVAGLNAARALLDEEPLLLGRDEAYIGVMIDDLVTRGTDEPYRMFTSRAEHRLWLREDNVVPRLLARAREAGLCDPARLERMTALAEARARLTSTLEASQVEPSDELNAALQQASSAPLKRTLAAAQLMRRPELSPERLRALLPSLLTEVELPLLRGVVTDLRYAGYLDHARHSQAREARLAAVDLPPDLAYAHIVGLSSEVREKLERVRPRTLAQAARIPGVTHAALACVAIELHRRGHGAPP